MREGPTIVKAFEATLGNNAGGVANGGGAAAVALVGRRLLGLSDGVLGSLSEDGEHFEKRVGFCSKNGRERDVCRRGCVNESG